MRLKVLLRKISIRATEIETLDNQNVLVPNSELVSSGSNKLGLRDTQGRLRIVIGVAYGSDVKKVQEIMEAIANEHPEVITDGRALLHVLFLWVLVILHWVHELRCRINRIDRRFTVQSDINFALGAAFKEAGINIPFPQRESSHHISLERKRNLIHQKKKKEKLHMKVLVIQVITLHEKLQ